MYQKFKQDPSSVDESWHEFLADYTPEVSSDPGNSQGAATAVAPDARAATTIGTEPALPRPSALRPSAVVAAAESPIPALADWCVIDLLEGDGSLRRAAMAAALD